MKSVKVLIAIIILLGFTKSNPTFKNLAVGDTFVVTNDEDNGLIDWNKNDTKIIFTSTFKGNSNIYMLDLRLIPFENSKDHFHQALYLDKFLDKSDVYLPLTTCKDTSFAQPKWSNDKSILAIASFNNLNEILILNSANKKIKSTQIKRVLCADWKSQEEIFFVKNKEPRSLYVRNLTTNTDSLLLHSISDIRGINAQFNNLLITCKEGLLDYNFSKNSKDWYPLEQDGISSAKIDDLSFVVRTNKGSASIWDLNNGKETMLLAGEGDKSPTVSNNLKYATFYSAFLKGIIIKKIK